MNKNELISLVAEKAGTTKKQTAEILDCTLDAIIETLMNNEKVQITGLGAFELKHREERDGINPQTHKPMKIQAADVPTFKLSKSFKERFI